MVQEFNKYFIQNQKSAYEMIKEFVDEQGIKLKEENMEDKNKTVAESIADLQNQLDRANNRIEGLVKKNDELKEVNDTQFKNLHDLRLEYNGLYNKFHALDIQHAALIGKYCDYYKAAQDAWNENNKIKKEIEKLKNENEYLVYENRNLSEEITKWHSKYTKEKVKHDKATNALKTAINSVYGLTSAKIDELTGKQEDCYKSVSIIFSTDGMDKYAETYLKEAVDKASHYHKNK